jgi:hypothetical protein
MRDALCQRILLLVDWFWGYFYVLEGWLVGDSVKGIDEFEGVVDVW